jgi:hypothetical protein
MAKVTARDKSNMMRLFIDTEFTDLIDAELISIGIVSEDGREFYAERSDVDLSRCGDFARVAVVPQLGREPALVGTEPEISTALLRWLIQFGPVEVCFDYATNFEWFFYLVRNSETLELPGSIKWRNIRGDLAAADIEQYWRENGRQAHHALHDAKANRSAFLSAKKSDHAV